MQRLLLIALLVGGAILGLFWLFPTQAAHNAYSYAHLLYAAMFLCYLLLFLRMEHGQWRRNLTYAALWLVLLFVFVLGYSYKAEMLALKDRLIGNILPASVQMDEEGLLHIRRSANGHFYLNLQVNRQDIRFMVDTGATHIVLSQNDAKHVGIDMDALSYSIATSTANGRSFSAPITLDSIGTNGIFFYDQPATVAQNMRDTSLLGMGFLVQFQAVTIEGDRLFLAP